MTTLRCTSVVVALCAVACWLPSADATAQSVSESGFVEGRGVGYPDAAPNDPQRTIGDVLARDEVFFRPAGWIQFAAGADFRANSHAEVEDTWRFDWRDRSIRRPRLALRRLSATISGHGLTLDLGKQFIRWGRTDIIYPTDRFAPRDFLDNVFDSEVLPVLGARVSAQAGPESFEAVWVPELTPSRIPLFDQRWTVVPPQAANLTLVDGGSRFPSRAEYGGRWRHTGDRLETALSYFDGFNHLPNIDVHAIDADTIELTRVFPHIRMYGGDAAIPTGWLTWKLEAAYVKSPAHETQEYVLYAIEIERQAGEWLFDVGYAGDEITREGGLFPFAPDLGIAKSVLGRAAYTAGPNRSFAVEGAVRQDGQGFYGKLEYSEALGQHWRFTTTAVGLGGDSADFIGQYRHNSHASAAIRLSF